MSTTEVAFEISLCQNLSHIYRVRCTLKNPRSSQVTFSIPSWTPGSYLIRDFSQHITSISANTSLSKIDKDSWLCTNVGGDLVIDYEVYAFDTSVRAAFLDDSYAFFTGTSVFMRFHDHEDVPHHLTIAKAPFHSRVATAMTATNVDQSGFGNYTSHNFDELVDHPVMIADFDLLTFNAEGVEHKIACYPKIDFDKARLSSDCAKICSEHIHLFGAPAPFSNYLFLLKIEENGYGGLEHRASSALICKISDLPMKHQPKMSDDYRTLLGLFSHEYFHAWNIKRLKPESFLNYNYNGENYTELLWFFEGFTSYYDDLILRRSGVIDTTSYLDLLAKAITRVHSENGRLTQSLSEASFDAWVKFYKPNENSPNAHVSYYVKGSLVALCLDFLIRKSTQNRKSLDDLMRAMWTSYGSQGKGITEAIIIEQASLIADKDLSNFFQTSVHSTADLPIAELFKSFGVDLQFKENNNVPYLGCNFKRDTEACVISSVALNTPAMQAGLSAGDMIIAVDGLKVGTNCFENKLSRYAAGERVKLHLFRRGWLKEIDVTLTEAPKTKCTLSLTANPVESEGSALSGWLR